MEVKSERCLRERGFSFADVVPAFGDPGRYVELDERWEYGEPFVIAYTRREGLVRIISARKANARERKRYGKGPPRG